MLDKYYQQELSYLRELATEFAEQHPGLAPLLAGQSTDPDVERILEGTAFLSGLVQQKLDGTFPELLHGLLEFIFPHYLRPLPATTLIEFKPKQGLRERTLVARGTTLGAVESENVQCIFTTTQDVDLAPLTISGVRFETIGKDAARLQINLGVAGVELSQLGLAKIRFFLAGDYNNASLRHWIIQTRTQKLTLIAGDGARLELPRAAIEQVGFKDSDALLPYPARSFPGYRILQEFFCLPAKFLFFDVNGLEVLKGRAVGNGFTLELELADLPANLPPMRTGDFKLFVTPAVNLFAHDADALILDHTKPDYLVRPSGQSGGYQVHSVKRVTGFVHGSMTQREYLPFELFNPQAQATAVYSLHHRLSPLSGKAELYISVAYPTSTAPSTTETLSLDLMCTNGAVPETLRAGDVRVPTESSPVLADFSNLYAPSPQILPPIGNDVLWRVLSHFFLNYHSIANADNLRALLKVYVFQETRNRTAVLANTKRIEAIKAVELKAADRFYRGALLRGQNINVEIDPQGFVGRGDIFLFGAVLDVFFASYAAINCFTRLTVQDSSHKERFTWPTRLGDRTLL